MIVGTVLYNPAPGNLSKFTNHLIVNAMNSLLHLELEPKQEKSWLDDAIVKTMSWITDPQTGWCSEGRTEDDLATMICSQVCCRLLDTHPKQRGW